jgi:hypothetical protein
VQVGGGDNRIVHYLDSGKASTYSSTSTQSVI